MPRIALVAMAVTAKVTDQSHEPSRSRRRTLRPLPSATGGQFRASIVQATLNGTRAQEPSSARTSEMPIWGSIFRQLDTRESVAKVRVENLVKFVESIQVR